MEDEALVAANPLRVAVVGAGAVSTMQHLPALRERADCEVVAVVDQDQARAREVAKRFGVPRAGLGHRDLEGQVDAAIVAVPNHAHASVTIDLLERGIHVLVEKPMAMSVPECEAMIEAADARGLVLAVGLFQRFSHPARFTKRAIETGLLGSISSYELESGVVFAWPVASDHVIRPEMTGGGVLMDSGVHSVDQVLWWFGDVIDLEYLDDSHGGVEADCLLRVTHEGGVRGVLEFSRTRALRQRAVIRGSDAGLDVGLWDNEVGLRLPNGPRLDGWATAEGVRAAPVQTVQEFTAAQHDDFFAAIREGRPPFASGAEGVRSVRLVRQCYERRQALILPWDEPVIASGGGR
jgi:predicted dehydrogenase